jgi:hypothetical protein
VRTLLSPLIAPLIAALCFACASGSSSYDELIQLTRDDPISRKWAAKMEARRAAVARELRAACSQAVDVPACTETLMCAARFPSYPSHARAGVFPVTLRLDAPFAALVEVDVNEVGRVVGTRFSTSKSPEEIEVMTRSCG